MTDVFANIAAWSAAKRQAEGGVPTPRLATVTQIGDAAAESRYAAKALEDEVTALAAMAPATGRNSKLNTAAFSLGQLVAGGLLNKNDVQQALMDACVVNGLIRDDGIPKCLSTFERALAAGAEHPRGAPERTPPWPTSSVATSATAPAPNASTTASTSAPAPTDADAPIIDPEQPEESLADITRRLFPTIDWHALWNDTSEEEWIVEPLLAARRLVALYSPPKVGKSLLMLEVAAAVAAGKEVLGIAASEPRNVLYVDFENDPKADVLSRLKALGYKAHELEHLHYLSFPTLAGLDSERGAIELMAAADVYDCKIVLVDTVSRAVDGEENDNDTWLSFYRHTGLRLKQAGIALMRLDHSGKDLSKGQRGGSAKSGDVDAIWKMTKLSETSFKLELDDSRMPIAERTLVLHRELHPRLHHRVDIEGRNAANGIKIQQCIEYLDSYGIPNSAGRPACLAAFKENGVSGYGGKAVLPEAMRIRRLRDESYVPQLLDADAPTVPEHRNSAEQFTPATVPLPPEQRGTARNSDTNPQVSDL